MRQTTVMDQEADAARRAAIGAIMSPKSVAVIGASGERHTLGNQVLKNLRERGYAGSVTAVHRRASQIEGFPVVPSISELPSDLDVAMVSVPAEGVPAVLQDLDQRGCRAAVVPAAGFDERQETELRAVIEDLRLLFTGPNCLGVLSVASKTPLWTPNFRGDLPRGRLALIAQSGSAAISVTSSPGVAFSRIISSGNEASLTSADYLSWLATDDETDAVGLILESVKDPAAFTNAVQQMRAVGKPLVALKVGRSQDGSRAAAAHTGALVTPYDAYEAFFGRVGVPLVADYDELVGTLQCLALPSLPASTGKSIGVFTISGGQSSLACDLAIENGLRIASFSHTTKNLIQEALPDTSGENPVDVGASIGAARRKPDQALRAVLDDPGVDAVMVIQDAHGKLPLNEEHGYLTNVRRVAEVSRDAKKPIILVSSASADLHPLFERALDGSPVPMLRGLRAGLVALRSLAVSEPHARLTAPPFRPGNLLDLRQAIAQESGNLSYHLTQRILHAYELPTVNSAFAKDVDEAVHIAPQLLYPVVVKVASRDLPHKTDVGGVIVGVSSPSELVAAVHTIAEQVEQQASDAVIEGFEFQHQIEGAVTETLLGFTVEPPFGPMVVVGSGGTLAELIDDRAAELAPLSTEEAVGMIQETALGRLLGGYRGILPPTDTRPLAQAVERLAALAIDLGDLLSEGDLNPAFVASPSGTVQIADALFVRQAPR